MSENTLAMSENGRLAMSEKVTSNKVRYNNVNELQPNELRKTQGVTALTVRLKDKAASH